MQMQMEENTLCRCGCAATVQKAFTEDKKIIFCVECYWDDYEEWSVNEDERLQCYDKKNEQIMGRTRSWTLFKREMAKVGSMVRLARYKKACVDENERRWAERETARNIYDEVLARYNAASKTYEEVAKEEMTARHKFNGMFLN